MELIFLRRAELVNEIDCEVAIEGFKASEIGCRLKMLSL